MVQLSTVVLAALAVAPALAIPISQDFETRDIQDLEVRSWATRSFDDFELEARAGKKKKNRKANNEQPQRESTGLSSTLGNLAGSSIGGSDPRDFVEEFDLEARNDKKKKRGNGNRQNNQRPQRQSTGLSNSLGNFAGSAVGAATQSNEGRDFFESDLYLEARNDKKKKRGNGNRQNNQRPQRQSTGLSNSLGNFAGSAVGAATQSNEGRDFFESELYLEARNDKKKKRGNGNRQNNQRPQRQSTGLSNSLGNFAGSAVGAATQSNEGRDFFDDFDLEARNEEKKRRRRARKQRQQQPQQTEVQSTGETRDFIDEDFVFEAREIDELD